MSAPHSSATLELAGVLGSGPPSLRQVRHEDPEHHQEPERGHEVGLEEAHEEPHDEERQADRPEETDSRSLGDHVEAPVRFRGHIEVRVPHLTTPSAHRVGCTSWQRAHLSDVRQLGQIGVVRPRGGFTNVHLLAARVGRDETEEEPGCLSQDGEVTRRGQVRCSKPRLHTPPADGRFCPASHAASVRSGALWCMA